MKDRYKINNKLMAFGTAIDFGNMSFNHTVQIQTCYLLFGFVMGTRMQKLETQVFVAI